MSYSGGSGKSFGNRGSPQRKEKKKKQEYHKHHLKFVPEEHFSLEQLKERVSLGLQKLGTQVFSSEPSGYGFQNWMTSFNLLLDDFEEKCSPALLPKEYYDMRLKLTAELLEPVNTTDVDVQISDLQKETGVVEERIADIAENSEKVAVEELRDDEVKIVRLKKERIQLDLDINSAKNNLEAERKRVSQSVFKRLFSGSEALKPLQAKVDSLVTEKDEVEKNIVSLEEDRVKKKGDAKKFGSDISGFRANLEELRAKLGELEAQKLAMTQIVEKRSMVTKLMADMISSLRLNSAPSNTEEVETMPEDGAR